MADPANGTREEETRPFYIRLPNSLRATLQEEANRQRRSLSGQIVVVLEEWAAEAVPA